MPIKFKCKACDAGLSMKDEFAGRRGKCPGCGTVFTVPQPAGSEERLAPSQNDASPLMPPSKRKPAARRPAVTTTRPSAASENTQAFESTDEQLPDFSAWSRENESFSGSSYDSSGESVPHTPGPRRKSGVPVWAWAAGGGVALLLVLGVIYLATASPSGSATQVANQDNGDGPVVAQSGGGGLLSFGSSATKLVLDWPARDRSDAALDIDGKRVKVPSQGPVEIELAAGSHRVVIRRRGFDQVEFNFALQDGSSYRYRPEFSRPVMPDLGSVAAQPQFDPNANVGNNGGGNINAGGMRRDGYADWLQDFDAAKARATAEGKDILIAMQGSDWCPFCVQLQQRVLFREGFREWIDSEYVLMIIDFPRGREAQERVADAERNELLMERFPVEGFPTIYLTDAEGQAYANYTPSSSGGVSGFRREIRQAQQVKQQRDSIFANVETSSGRSQLRAAETALEFLNDRDLEPFHGPTIDKWLKIAEMYDADNRGGSLEKFFQAHWLAKLQPVPEEDHPALVTLADEFDAFRKQHELKEDKVAVQLHFYAAQLLMVAGERDRATEQVEAALARNPPEELAAYLQHLAGRIRNGSGSGTGWLISNDGHLMTNHHVIEDANSIEIRIPGVNQPVTAQVLAQDEERDMALLKFDIPENVVLKPLVISTKPTGRGARVAVFGFPLGTDLGEALKLTTGIISSSAEQTRNNMHLLDCRVNPGNSGGPLCDAAGNVIGMVTAKSGSGGGVDSYGMALPATDLDAFLKLHLPGYQTVPATEVGSVPREWSDVDRIVSPSVLMVVTF